MCFLRTHAILVGTLISKGDVSVIIAKAQLNRTVQGEMKTLNYTWSTIRKLAKNRPTGVEVDVMPAGIAGSKD